ncbi:uncharacterized protein LOC134801996 [Cydia splendana]|uniref:uncharacterized protein LOC134801996 n=1 Tax=Cydia splendana TaxID=1100963 RepID=UPI00300D34FE
MEAVLPPPLPFSFTNNLENVTSGNLSKEWEKWRKSFQVYYEACELSKKSAQVQMSILLHVIGEQCREVHAQFEGTFASLKDLLDKFESFFSPKKNITIERHRFFTRCQKQSESIEQYAFELKKLASACEFKELIDDLIRDRLICGIQENALRERLLREPDLTLKKSLEICNIAQISKVQAGSIKKESSEHEAYTYNITASNSQDQFMLEEGGIPYGQVNWISRRGGYGARGAPRGRGRGWSQPAPRPAPPRRRAAPAQTAVSSREMRQQRQQTGPYGEIKSGVQCLKCGFAHGIYMKCPALGKMCLSCNNYDHFSRMCTVYNVQAVESSVEPIDQVIYCLSNSSSDWSIDLTFGADVTINFKLDTGADANILPIRYLSQVGLAEQDLSKTCIKYKSYSANDIIVLGTCHLKVQYKNNFYILEFVIADVPSYVVPVLGRESCSELEVVRLIKDISVIQDYEYIFHEYNDVFEGLGCMPGEYKIEIDSSIRPVVHAPRKMPVALKDSIKEKLDNMVDEGIIAKVEGPTDWVNNTLSRAVEPTRGPVEVPRDQLDLQAQVCAIAVSNPLLDTHFVKIQVATQNDVEIQTVLSDNAVTSSSGVAGAPRALDTGFDSRDTVAHPGPSSILSAPTNNNSNNYVTRSGREVIVPDRWGSWGW